MSQPLLIALFENKEEVETALNEITQSGFDLQDISIVVKEEVDQDTKLTDEENKISIIISEIGPITFAGPIAKILTDSEIGDIENSSTEIEFIKILAYLGIPFEDATSYESFMKSNYTLIAIPVEDEDSEDEIRTILNTFEAELIEKTKANW